MATYAETRTMQSPRTASFLPCCWCFSCGTAAGRLAMNLRPAQRIASRSLSGPIPGKDLSIRRLQRELDLTPEQTEQLKTILDDFAHYYRDVLNTGKGSIYKILNDQQKRKFDRLLNEPEAR